MQVGGVEMYLGHGTLFVGSTADVDLVIFDDDASVSATAEHVRLAARPQQLVRVRLWQRVGPRHGRAVFDGRLKLLDGRLAVSEGTGLVRYVLRVDPTPDRVVVAVDDPGHVSRVDVVLDPEFVPRSTQLWQAGEPPFPALTVPPTARRHRADEVGDALAGHDFPVRRLATALALIHEEVRQARGALDVRFYVEMVVEWLRWLHEHVTYGACRDAGELISRLLTDRGPSDRFGEESARTVLAFLGDRVGGPVLESIPPVPPSSGA